MFPIKDAKLNWDFGTAYDLFVSLYVLHNPDRFGLRANWAAGVRSRISPDLRTVLDHAQTVFPMPLRFIFDLPTKNKDSAAVLDYLGQLYPSKRVEAIDIHRRVSPAYLDILHDTTKSRPWTEAEKEILLENTASVEKRKNPRYLESLYFIWSDIKSFGEMYLTALTAYVDNFFAEEEMRILPALKQVLSYAQMRAGSLSLPLLLEELTSGVRFSELENAKAAYLAPSFWSAPFMLSSHYDEETFIILFGARPDNMAIIPGDPVPDSLMRALKALADPTRLRIMRFLAQSPQTAMQLSRSLRLRPPTVNHHINELRIAGMIHVSIGSEGEKQYSTRYDGVDATHNLLNRYLHGV